ncbi:hypothetical protein [Methylomagnum ishizawai]|uniref:hypothetical protein n=1 Tax=Methylomagnum ishizawai TaxID=1760988 RepID=UPI000A15103F|nr:hypothetical protein [Methylomagnum ishizawai]
MATTPAYTQAQFDAASTVRPDIEAGELVRLKHITGFSKLFKDTQYKRAWVTKNQILLANKLGVKP